MYKPDKQEKKPDVQTQRSQDILKKVEDSRQQHQFQILLQDNQLDKNVKKALAVMFCTGNTRKEVNIDKDIINAENYLDDNITNNNNLATNHKSSDIKMRNHEENAEKSLEELFANAYKNNKLVQAIIDAKVRSMRKLLCEILKKVMLFMRNLEIKNSRLNLQDNIYVLNDQNLWLYLLRR